MIDLYSLVGRPRGLAAHELPRDERHALARAVKPLVWPGFATTQGSKRTGDTITIFEYDSTWPAQYERWRGKINSALGDAVVLIEHVGSTSVPDLPAKPIIDIQVSVIDLENEAAYAPALEQLGVQLRSRDEWHRSFRPFPGRPRDVHVHVCATGSAWEREHVLFRDYLRSNEQARRAYAAAKRQSSASVVGRRDRLHGRQVRGHPNAAARGRTIVGDARNVARTATADSQRGAVLRQDGGAPPPGTGTTDRRRTIARLETQTEGEVVSR